MEMVLAMMLAAIVIGMAYSAFTMFSRLYGSYHTKNLDHASVQVFREVLHADMDHAEFVFADETQLRFKASGDDSRLLSYRLGPDYLIRNTAELQDTFKIKGLMQETLFEGKAVTTGIVDQILYRFEYTKTPMIISVHKKYTSADLFTYRDSLWKQ